MANDESCWSDELLERVRWRLLTAAELADANGAFDARDQFEREAEEIAEIQRARAAKKTTKEGGMASEDVLERADRYDSYHGGYELDAPSTERLIEDLAAEVRELRKDKSWAMNACEALRGMIHDQEDKIAELEKDRERLDWLDDQTGEGLLVHSTRGGCEVEWSGYGLGTLGGTRTLREAIDAAMKERSVDVKSPPAATLPEP